MLDIDVISHPLRMEKISDHFHIFRRWCSVFTMGRIPSSLILLLTFIEPRFPTFSSLARFSLSSIPGSLSRLDFPFLLMLISMSCVSVHFYHPSFFPSHPAQAQVIFSSPFPIDLFSHFLIHLLFAIAISRGNNPMPSFHFIFLYIPSFTLHFDFVSFTVATQMVVWLVSISSPHLSFNPPTSSS